MASGEPLDGVPTAAMFLSKVEFFVFEPIDPAIIQDTLNYTYLEDFNKESRTLWEGNLDQAVMLMTAFKLSKSFQVLVGSASKGINLQAGQSSGSEAPETNEIEAQMHVPDPMSFYTEYLRLSRSSLDLGGFVVQ